MTTSNRENNMKVIELVVENYMGVKAVMIRPVGNVVRIEGKNGAGKSSVIDAIWVALAGMGESGTHPLRKGEKKGRAFVDLGDIRVERKFTENNTYLEVSDKEGRRIPRPQEFLDQFYSKTTIDPQNFINMKPPERRDLLLDLTGKRDEIEELDEQRIEMYDERTLLNREVKVLQGKLAGRSVGVDEAMVEVPIAELLKELEISIASDNGLVQDEAFVDSAIHRIELKNSIAESHREQIRKLQEEIEVLENEIQCLDDDMDAADYRVKSAPESKTVQIRAQIADAEKTNILVRGRRELMELDSQLKAKEIAADNLTNAIEGIDDRKIEILQESALSIGQVGFDGDALLVNDTPFDDLSRSEQLRVSLEIALSQNPRIRVVRVSDGNVFDADNMDEIEQWAQKHDCQLWIEKVLDMPDGMGFFIKDGRVEE